LSKALGIAVTEQGPQRRAGRFLYAHCHQRRTVFVTENAALFGEPGSTRREQLAKSASTQILSLAEFERWCGASTA